MNYVGNHICNHLNVFIFKNSFVKANFGTSEQTFHDFINRPTANQRCLCQECICNDNNIWSKAVSFNLHDLAYRPNKLEVEFFFIVWTVLYIYFFALSVKTGRFRVNHVYVELVFN